MNDKVKFNMGLVCRGSIDDLQSLQETIEKDFNGVYLIYIKISPYHLRINEKVNSNGR